MKGESDGRSSKKMKSMARDFGEWLPSNAAGADTLGRQCEPSERCIRIRNRTPHMRHRAVVVAETFSRLLEVASDQIDERIDRYFGGRVERVEVVDGDGARGIVPAMVAHETMRGLHVRRGDIVDAEDSLVEIRSAW
jgi:hypothetical protein